MPKLRRMSGRERRKILEQHGYRFVRQKGSHMIMQLALDGGTITIPVPDHTELRLGTLSSIIRQSRLPRVLFEAVCWATTNRAIDGLWGQYCGG